MFDVGCTDDEGSGDRVKAVREAMGKVKPLHKTISKPNPGDWLAEHEEPGQTFDEYRDCSPILPRGKRKVLYIQPVGEFSATERRIVDLTADFMGRYFALEVKVKETIGLEVVPDGARRRHPDWGMEQVLTGYVLDDLLKPALPDDAVAFIAFTNSDLWPGKGWNFVFGQASIYERVGVWSIYRNGDPEKEFHLALLRTLKTATHETGHMLSMLHCTLYECNMCGSNHREESDRRPVTLCPECAAKVWWGCKADPIKRYQSLAAFCKEAGLKAEADFYEKSIEALK